MFLLSEEQAERPRTSKFSQLSKRDEGPEPDSVREMDRIRKLFDLPLVDSYDYRVEQSQKSIHASGELLRAIGGATYEHREGRGRPGGRSEATYLLDGLAQGLLAALFAGVSISTAPSGASRTTSEMLFTELMASISPSDSWALKLKHSGKVKERDYLITVEGVTERLVFRASSTDLLDRSFQQQNARELLPVSLTGRAKPRSLRGRRLKEQINSVIEDQSRRTRLALEYAAAPVSQALPPELRAEIKRKLEAVDIPNGSYSREGFSSGKFFYRFTQAQIKGRAYSLLFQRCSFCRSVCRLSIPHGSYEQQEAIWKLNEDSVYPWHSSICDSSRLTSARRSSMLYLTQAWEENWPLG